MHWKVVLAAMAGMATSTITSYSTALFYEPFEQEFGWKRADVASAHLIASTAAILFSPWVGHLIDRFGPRRIGILAAVAMCLSICLGALAGPNIWTWRAIWCGLAVAVVLIQPMVWTSAITSLFTAGRGLALAVTLCGSGIGSIVTPPLTYELIERFGWRLAFVGLGVFWALASIPLLILYFRGARDMAGAEGGSSASTAEHSGTQIRETVLSRRFLQLLVAAFCIAIVIVPLVMTIVPVLSSVGLARGSAAGIASLIGIASISGRLCIGFLLDRVTGRIVAAICVCLPIVGSGILIGYPGSAPAATIAVLVYGLALGAELDIVAYLTSRYFSLSRFGTLFGIIGAFITLAGASGPVLLNLVYDRMGTYMPALWAGMPLCLASAVLFLFLGPYPVSSSEEA